MFFFSSRRRHTRYWRDWSSDVCSSDLRLNDDGGPARRATGPATRRPPPSEAAQAAARSGAPSSSDGSDGPGSNQIGRASGRERVENSVVAVSFKKKKI